MTKFPKIEALIEGEAPERRAELERILGPKSGFTAEHVARVLTDAGHPLSASTIKLYRRTKEHS